MMDYQRKNWDWSHTPSSQVSFHMFSFLQQNEKSLFYNNHKKKYIFLEQWSHILDKQFDI